MTVAKLNTDAIDQCRTTVSSQKAQFGSIGDGFPNQCGNPSIFGKLGSSGQFSGAVDALNTAAHTEFIAAEQLLDKIERALDAISRSVTDVEETNKTGMRAV